jgi:hypothetical protein
MANIRLINKKAKMSMFCIRRFIKYDKYEELAYKRQAMATITTRLTRFEKYQSDKKGKTICHYQNGKCLFFSNNQNSGLNVILIANNTRHLMTLTLFDGKRWEAKIEHSQEGNLLPIRLVDIPIKDLIAICNLLFDIQKDNFIKCV